MTTLKNIMDLNKNYELMVKVAPNCPWDEGQKLQEWFLNCAKQWLTQKRNSPELKTYSLDVLDELLEELQK